MSDQLVQRRRFTTNDAGQIVLQVFDTSQPRGISEPRGQGPFWRDARLEDLTEQEVMGSGETGPC